MDEKYIAKVNINNFPFITAKLPGDKYGLVEIFNGRMARIKENLSIYFDEEIVSVALPKIWYDLSGNLLTWSGKKGGDIIITNASCKATEHALHRVDPFDEHYPLSQGNFNDIQKDIVRTFLPRRISGPTYYDETLFKERRQMICKTHNIGFFKYYKEKMIADREVKRVIKQEKKKKLLLGK